MPNFRAGEIRGDMSAATTTDNTTHRERRRRRRPNEADDARARARLRGRTRPVAILKGGIVYYQLRNVLWMTEFQWFWTVEFVYQQSRMSSVILSGGIGISELRTPTTQNVQWMTEFQWLLWAAEFACQQLRKSLRMTEFRWFWTAELYTTNSECPMNESSSSSEVKLVILFGTNFVGFFRGPKNWKNLGKMHFPIVNLAIYISFFQNSEKKNSGYQKIPKKKPCSLQILQLGIFYFF